MPKWDDEKVFQRLGNRKSLYAAVSAEEPLILPHRMKPNIDSYLFPSIDVI